MAALDMDVLPIELVGKTAADLMTPSVITILTSATISDAASLLTTKNLSAVPVLAEDGRPVGVVSKTDIVAYDSKCYAELELLAETGNKESAPVQRIAGGPRPPMANRAHSVWEIMNPVLFSVAPTTEAHVLIDIMVTMNLHRLFVQGSDGRLVGVVSALDVLRHLYALPPAQSPD